MEPEEIIKNWDLLSNTTIKQVHTGLLNQTFIVRDSNDGLYILQQVHSAVAMDGAFENYFSVTQFLHGCGTVAQEYIKTTSGELWVEINGVRWRLLRGVEGNVYTNSPNTKTAFEAGKLLGEFHVNLKDYPTELAQGRFSFRYQPEMNKLENYKKLLLQDKNSVVGETATLLLKKLPNVMLPENLPQIIIHGDPKITNFLFDEQDNGICMIDFDTLQKLTPLYELGDAIRSWCGQQEDNPNNMFDEDIYRSLLDGYYETSKNLLSQREKSLIPQAAQLVMLGLATRFLNDYIDDNYFGWDETRYKTRKEHNLARTIGQISLYKSFMRTLT